MGDCSGLLLEVFIKEFLVVIIVNLVIIVPGATAMLASRHTFSLAANDRLCCPACKLLHCDQCWKPVTLMTWIQTGLCRHVQGSLPSPSQRTLLLVLPT